MSVTSAADRYFSLHFDFSAVTLVLRRTSCDFTQLCLVTLTLIRKTDWLQNVIEMRDFPILNSEIPQNISVLSTCLFLSRIAKEEGKFLRVHVIKSRAICKIGTW
jgi:hypothetical protein